MSRSVREEIVIAASPEQLWDTIMDPTQLERWVSTHESVNGVKAGPAEEGEQFDQKLRLAGATFKVGWRVIEANRPHLARWTGDGPAGSTANVEYRLTAEDGGTRFSYCNEFALPGGALGKAAGKLLSRAPARREARRSLENLRALLETR